MFKNNLQELVQLPKRILNKSFYKINPKKISIISSNKFGSKLNLYESKYNFCIFGISKRIIKHDKFRYLLIDLSLMDFNQNVLEKETVKFKFLDFNNNIKIEKNKRKNYLFTSNNKFICINKINVNNEIIKEENLIYNKKYQDEFVKSKLQYIVSKKFMPEKKNQTSLQNQGKSNIPNQSKINKYNEIIKSSKEFDSHKKDFGEKSLESTLDKKILYNSVKLVVIDETFDKNSFDYINSICIERKIPLLVADSHGIIKNMSKYYFPVNLTPVLNVEFDFKNIMISYTSSDQKENKILSKVMSYEYSGILKIFEDFRIFLNALRIQKLNKNEINKKDTFKIQNQNQALKNTILDQYDDLYSNTNLDESVIVEIKKVFQEIYKENYISNSNIINFINEIAKIIEKFNINNLPEDLNRNKIQLNKYMFPLLKFDENENKIYLDQISNNLKYQAYEKAKSKNKVILKKIQLEHVLHIIFTFSKSLETILNFNLYSIFISLRNNNNNLEPKKIVKINFNFRISLEIFFG